MFQSHWSYTECGLGCEATDQLIELVRRRAGQDLLFGAKITGGGAGGTVAVLGVDRGSRMLSTSWSRNTRKRMPSSRMFSKAVQWARTASVSASCERAQ